MGIIRKVKESDYDFIYKNIREYSVALTKNIEKYAIQMMIEERYSFTCVYEDNNHPLAFFSVITHPKSFIQYFHSSVPIFKRIAYLINNKLNMYNMDSGNNQHIPEEYKYMYNNIYNVDSDFVVGLFAYSQSKEMIMKTLAIYSFRSISSQYKYMIGSIKKDNKVSILNHRMTFGHSMQLFDADKEVFFCVIDINDFLAKNNNFNTKHEIII